MKDNCLYFDITRRERDSAIRYLLGAIITSRDEEGFPSNYYVFDEDVNVYLAHLLFAIALPEYHDMAQPYLSQDSSEVMRWINETEDQTIRYFIYKVNADHILVHSAIFDDLKFKGKPRFFGYSKRYYQELAKLYYEQASAYHKRIYRKNTGVGDVLDKIACYFDDYQNLLREVRRKYFHFVNNFRDQAFHGFMRQVTRYERSTTKKDRLDEFLDVYGRWLATKDKSLESSIYRLAAQLKDLDPEFRFDPARQLGNHGGFEDEKKCA